jgi:hypothetical protein
MVANHQDVKIVVGLKSVNMEKEGVIVRNVVVLRYVSIKRISVIALYATHRRFVSIKFRDMTAKYATHQHSVNMENESHLVVHRAKMFQYFESVNAFMKECALIVLSVKY